MGTILFIVGLWFGLAILVAAASARWFQWLRWKNEIHSNTPTAPDNE